MNSDDRVQRALVADKIALQADADRAAARFAEQAAASGDAAISFARIDTPIGTASIAATDRGLVSVGLPNRGVDDFLAELADGISPRIVEAPGALDAFRREFEQYFEGGRETFDLGLDWRLVPGGFYRKVLRATAKLPFGVTATYGEIAGKAGNPRAHRAAGTALGANPIPIVIPCHRIVRSGGDPGNYGGGPEVKKWLLTFEGALQED